jgi:predicted DNA-binding ribbon-helix-helix protein
MERDENGNFTHKGYGEKKTRAIRISDEGWDKLQALAESQNCSRADLIENLARSKAEDREIVIKALEAFLNIKQANWGSNGSQKGEFNSNSRTWDIFNQFKAFVEPTK